MIDRMKRRQVDRITNLNRALLEPPRDVAFSEGAISWTAPRHSAGVTHYRIYKNNENTLVRQVPSGQTILEDNLSADRVFVSSWNEGMGRESRKVLLDGPVGAGSGLYKGTY